MRYLIHEPKELFDSNRTDVEDFHLFYRHLRASLEARAIPWQACERPPSSIKSGERAILYHPLHSKQSERIYRFKRAYLKNQFYFENRGYSGWSALASSKNLFQLSQTMDRNPSNQFVKAMVQEYFMRNQSKIRQPETPFQPPLRPFVFLPMQVPRDQVMALARIELYELVRRVAEVLQAGPYDLLIKRHPRCTDPEAFALLSELSRLPHVKLTTAALREILPRCEAVVCINSGVGFESLFFGKQVFTAGYSDYEWVTNALKNRDSLNELPDLIGKPVDQERMNRFLYFVCKYYYLDCNDFDTIQLRLLWLEGQKIPHPDEGTDFGPLSQGLFQAIRGESHSDCGNISANPLPTS